jgi:hypothetical protein
VDGTSSSRTEKGISGGGGNDLEIFFVDPQHGGKPNRIKVYNVYSDGDGSRTDYTLRIRNAVVNYGNCKLPELKFRNAYSDGSGSRIRNADYWSAT